MVSAGAPHVSSVSTSQTAALSRLSYNSVSLSRIINWESKLAMYWLNCVKIWGFRLRMVEFFLATTKDVRAVFGQTSGLTSPLLHHAFFSLRQIPFPYVQKSIFSWSVPSARFPMQAYKFKRRYLQDTRTRG